MDHGCRAGWKSGAPPLPRPLYDVLQWKKEESYKFAAFGGVIAKLPLTEHPFLAEVTLGFEMVRQKRCEGRPSIILDCPVLTRVQRK